VILTDAVTTVKVVADALKVDERVAKAEDAVMAAVLLVGLATKVVATTVVLARMDLAAKAKVAAVAVDLVAKVDPTIVVLVVMDLSKRAANKNALIIADHVLKVDVLTIVVLADPAVKADLTIVVLVGLAVKVDLTTVDLVTKVDLVVRDSKPTALARMARVPTCTARAAREPQNQLGNQRVSPSA
jgi:hypothetical protein